MRPRLNMGEAAEPLEPTYSRAQVMEHFGCGSTALHELMVLGRKFKGCHPLRGGLYPVFRVTHKNVRIPLGAIRRHLAHMERLATDTMFACEMKAKARGLGEAPSAMAAYFERRREPA